MTRLLWEEPPLRMAMAVRPRACPGACVCLLYRPNAEYFISDGLVHVPAVRVNPADQLAPKLLARGLGQSRCGGAMRQFAALVAGS